VPPITSTLATPGIEVSLRLIVVSASAVRSTGDSVSEATVSDMIGKSDAENRDSIGSSISTGRSRRFSEILSRMSWVACWMSFSNTNTTTIEA